MMKTAALVAILSAPAALAFVPADLTGVWSCVPEDGTYFTNAQSGSDDIEWQEVDADMSHRVVVFNEPHEGATRHFDGRTYYSYAKDDDKDVSVEEHDFQGIMKNALQGDWYAAPNSLNPECSTTTCTDTTCIADLKPAITDGLYVGDDVYSTTQAADTAWRGQCHSHAAGPFSFVMDDADHFSLQVDVKNRELNHAFESSSASDKAHVFVIEKCMRGLPKDSVMCDNLERSDISSETEMNNACQGVLQCLDIDEDDEDKGKNCATAPVPAPVYQQPYYPQYYQPQQFYPQPQQVYQPWSAPQSFTPQWFGGAGGFQG